MEYVKELIDRYKHLRSKKQLQAVYGKKYAFVGIGGHSTSNLYPVLDYLHIPLKYICCRSTDKVRLIERRYANVIATTSLEDILKDSEVSGVFVSASPSAHFSLASKVLESGKSLFVEKPPCSSSEELRMLAEKHGEYGSPVVIAGLQKRYSPVTKILKQRLKQGKTVSYNMRYLTGAYPEGDAVLDLFIHPLDLVCYLFGTAEVSCVEHIGNARGGHTYMVVLTHRNATGMLELSTAYSWTDAQESLVVNTEKGTYTMNQMETLEYSPKQGVFMGVPVEKVFPRHSTSVRLFSRNNFVPTMLNNQIYTQGYFDEIKLFADSVEASQEVENSSFETLADTYALMDALRASVK